MHDCNLGTVEPQGSELSPIWFSQILILILTLTLILILILLITRQVGTELQLYRITGVQRTCSFLFSLGNDMPFPSFPPSGNEGNRNGGA